MLAQGGHQLRQLPLRGQAAFNHLVAQGMEEREEMGAAVLTRLIYVCMHLDPHVAEAGSL